ncbi:MAG TPA: hypothetical protein VM493_11155, partial [Vicinamibacterales bacterium]|nr:hypothetical protein [Vicinamibacterales bacterium]
MPELRDDTTDDGFHEIQFSSKQLVFLFMAASAILISVFIFGVLVGRDTTTRPPEESISANPDTPADPSAAVAGNEPKPPTDVPPAAAGGDRLRYPDDLGGGGKSNPSTANPPAAAPPPVSVPEPTQEAPKADPKETAKPT